MITGLNTMYGATKLKQAMSWKFGENNNMGELYYDKTMGKRFMQYQIQVLDHPNKATHRFPKDIEVTLPADIEMYKNHSLMFNQIKQDFLIEHPQFDEPDRYEVLVFFIGSLIPVNFSQL